MSAVSRFDNWITERFYRELLTKLAHAEEANDSALAKAVEARLADVVVVPPADVMTQRVQFAAVVTLFHVEEGEEQTFQIVSDDDADPHGGKIGSTSPLACALYGAREGETVSVLFEAGQRADYEVTHIRAQL